MSPAILIPAGLAIVVSTYGLARYSYGLFVPQIRADFNLSVEMMGRIASGSYAGCGHPRGGPRHSNTCVF